ncbi:hypothetical protein AB6A40_004245 [Gnathostoma spinigerum]|uniref:Uncharacterized protein n=1 Tax=Gnathostoma spinigerum TaxID=75299 RepID=A0ABD6EE90_9BILA
MFLPSVVFLNILHFISFWGLIKPSDQSLLCFNSPADRLQYVKHVHLRSLLCTFLLVYLVVISSAFINAHKNIWSQSPFRALPWLTTSFFCIFLQLFVVRHSTFLIGSSLDHCSVILQICTLMWIPLMVLFNELCKKWLIRLHARDQRRRKLCFNTKLGMNSPY